MTHRIHTREGAANRRQTRHPLAMNPGERMPARPRWHEHLTRRPWATLGWVLTGAAGIALADALLVIGGR